MDESSSSSTTIRLSSRAIDRYNPIIRDSSRLKKSSQYTTIPSSPNEQPARKSAFGTTQIIAPPLPTRAKNSTSQKKRHIFSKSKENNPDEVITGCVSFTTKLSNIDDKRKSAAATETTSENGDDTSKKKSNNHMTKKKSSWSCTNPGEFFSPPGSSRYLLTSTNQKSSVNLPDFDPLLPPPSPLLPPADCNLIRHNDAPSAASPPTQQVVVVLRVSLHCRGCEKKMRKHLSRMDGVTSFDIDFAAKKLTVVGNVTPLAVLASVSKVKNAQLLTLPQSSSTPAATDCSETKQNVGAV